MLQDIPSIFLWLTPMSYSECMNTSLTVELSIENYFNAYCGSHSSNSSSPYSYPVPSIGTTTVGLAPFDVFPGFDSSGSHLKTEFNYTLSSPNTRRTTVPTSYAIVTHHVGCGQFDACSGHGVCDYCLQRCHCADGYGSDQEKKVLAHALDISPTCAERTLETCLFSSAITGLCS